jgi:hypothetical protein
MQPDAHGKTPCVAPRRSPTHTARHRSAAWHVLQRVRDRRRPATTGGMIPATARLIRARPFVTARLIRARPFALIVAETSWPSPAAAPRCGPTHGPLVAALHEARATGPPGTIGRRSPGTSASPLCCHASSTRRYAMRSAQRGWDCNNNRSPCGRQAKSCAQLRVRARARAHARGGEEVGRRGWGLGVWTCACACVHRMGPTA